MKRRILAARYGYPDPVRGNTQILFHMFELGLDMRGDASAIQQIFNIPLLTIAPGNCGSIKNEFPKSYDSGPLALRVLYSFIRSKRPEIVVETGVANGASTRAILSALDANQTGRLISFDVNGTCGSVANGAEGQDRWEFCKVPLNDAKAWESIESKLVNSSIGLWYHDSDHEYAWQKREYALALSLMKSGGVLISDDIDANLAFSEFVQANERVSRSVGIFDERKILGIAEFR